jgi:uncharacterized protein
LTILINQSLFTNNQSHKFMFKNKFFLLSVLAVIVAIIAYSFIGNEENNSSQAVDNEYVKSIQNLRSDKDSYLKKDTASPIEDKIKFVGLKYFDVNPAFKVTGKIDRVTSGQTINISMTGGEVEEYEAYGNVKFEIEGVKCVLKIFKTPEGNLFLPFKDLTSNKETYGAGRYLDFGVNEVNGNQITIDFNKAYHPYCAYNHTFTCPVPPAENSLNVAVKAGERL